MYHSFEGMRLIDHLRNGSNPLKIRTIGSYSINAYISDKQHTLFTLAFRFGAKQPRQESNILISGFNNGQHFHLFIV